MINSTVLNANDNHTPLKHDKYQKVNIISQLCLHIQFDLLRKNQCDTLSFSPLSAVFDVELSGFFFTGKDSLFDP